MDITLYHCEKGNKEPFILLHGNGEDGTYFKHQIDYFSDIYRVITLDTRGHGKSQRGNAPFTIKQFAKDLDGFMNYMGITKAIILGFSDGANIAMEFALKYPHRVNALILNAGNLNPKGVKKIIQLPIELGYKIATKFSSKSQKAKANAEMLGLMVNEPNIDSRELIKISVPTLVICGTRDMIKESHTKEIVKSIPNAKLAIVKGNHFIANKNPRAFNKEIEDFLRRLLNDN